VLRKWAYGDWDALHHTFGDPEVMRWLNSEPASLESTAFAVGKMSMHWQAFGYGMWATVEKASGDLIGRIGLMYHADWPVEPHKIELGWTLSRSAWGKGYATEGARACVHWAFENLALERLISITRAENVRSARVMQKCGFSKQGTAHWRGLEQDWWALDRPDWKKRTRLSIGVEETAGGGVG
jgi:RimJ/RimL family protein N-acetyltransferase